MNSFSVFPGRCLVKLVKRSFKAAEIFKAAVHADALDRGVPRQQQILGLFHPYLPQVPGKGDPQLFREEAGQAVTADAQIHGGRFEGDRPEQVLRQVADSLMDGVKQGRFRVGLHGQRRDQPHHDQII